MRTCCCGALPDDRCARCAALRVLDLGPSATGNDVKNAYRVLVKVWHPDRFQNDAKLREAADAKLKALNSAYFFLLAKSDPTNHAETDRSSSFGAQPGAFSADGAVRSWKPAPAAARRRSRFYGRLIPSPLSVLMLAVFACGLLLSALFVKAADSELASLPVTGRIYSEIRDDMVLNLRVALGNLWNQTGPGLHGIIPSTLVPQKAIAAASGPQLANAEGPQSPAQTGTVQVGAPHLTQSLHRRELGAAHAAPARLRPYITTGMTQDEVIAIEGTPTSASEDKLVYGSSVLDFTEGKLSGWKIDSASSPVRVKLWPISRVDPDLEFFTVGSSKNAVLVVQGTPTSLSQDQFGYGGSVVYFQNNRVVSWKNDLSTVPLRVAP
jgi:DnaJ domain